MDKPLLFCAIDTPDFSRASFLAAAMERAGWGIKLGLEFFSANGPDGVRRLCGETGLSLFLDLKFHDIPNTVEKAVRAIVPLCPAYINVHAVGGSDMMRAAADAAQDEAAKHGIPAPGVLAVTVLTSFSEADLKQTGVDFGIEGQVKGLTELALRNGMNGIVCSAWDVEYIYDHCGPGFVTMVPGVRPAGAPTHDQKRTATPEQAIQWGATHLVIGRAVTEAADPEAAAREISAGIS